MQYARKIARKITTEHWSCSCTSQQLWVQKYKRNLQLDLLNDLEDSCIKRLDALSEKRCLFVDFCRCHFGRQNEHSKNLLSTNNVRQIEALVPLRSRVIGNSESLLQNKRITQPHTQSAPTSSVILSFRNGVNADFY